jgi:hypothetical protein
LVIPLKTLLAYGATPPIHCSLILTTSRCLHSMQGTVSRILTRQ